MTKYLLAVAFCFLLLGCQLTSFTPNDENTRFALLVEQEKSIHARFNPFASSDASASRQLPDLSPEALLDRQQNFSNLLGAIEAIDVTQLSAGNVVNHTILKYRVKNQVDNYINGDHYIPLMAESGFHVSISDIANTKVMKTVADYQDYLARLAALPRYFEQQIYWMEQGLKVGITQPKVVLKGFEESIAAYITDRIEDNVYFRPFNKFPASFSAQQKSALLAQARLAIAQYVTPSYQKFYQFMVDTYIPSARDNVAANQLPNGDGFYQNRVEYYTTTKKTAEEIHQLGLKEVARIRGEMAQIIEALKFQGSFADFLQFLRSNEQFYAKTPRQLLMEASFIAKSIDAKLPAYFKTLPRSPYGVAPVPAEIAPKYTTGRYKGASRDDEAGFYWVNTFALDRRPLYVLPALTLHEAVPGHHLQIALSRELDNVPEFRRQTYISAFGEGWALYTEWLGVEMGIYQDHFAHFGRLTYEMWRACRLVVDTGLHTKGWSRQQAIDYLAGNTALSMHNVTTEIDRYISWPGQALSYKMGELTIKQLRKQAEQALQDKFDIREFHDEILKNGAIPLSLLEQNIQRYIQSKQKEEGRQQS